MEFPKIQMEKNVISEKIQQNLGKKNRFYRAP